MLETVLLLLQFGASCAMLGVMWFVQIAYYPNLACIGGVDFIRYQQEHIRRVSGVAWIMLATELITAILLPVFATSLPLRIGFVINLLLILEIWRSTWFVQVPLHKVLEQGFQAEAHQRLVRTNWLRTICYSLRGALLLGIMIYSFALQTSVVGR